MILRYINSRQIYLWLLLVCMFSSSCGELKGVQPIPADKQSFIGKWNSEVGLSVEILSKGTANILRTKTMSGSDTLAINASDLMNFRVYFPNDSIMLLIQPFNIAREYKIDKYPTTMDSQITMTLNGVRLVRENLKNNQF
jgi:hypothetical protein